MENETKNEGKKRKAWIIICLAVFIALVFAMAKFFIINPSSSNEKLFSGSEFIAETRINSAQNNTKSQQRVSPKPQPSSIPEAETPPAPNNETEIPPPSETPKSDEQKTIEEPKTTATPSASDKFILTNPLKVLDIKEISKFRSCAEESYGKTSFQDQKESESSLEHYFKLKSSGTSIFAPFDGEIIYSSSSKVIIEVRPFNGWMINISGINLKSELSLNSQIKSGDEIGKSTENEVGIAVSGFTQSQKDKKYKDYSNQNLDSIFSHLNDSVSKEFSDKSIMTSNIIVSKTDRDSKACAFSSDNADDWVKL
ncbi:MAG: hypothetical protein Q7S18_01700 [bacterium]|nr:hypothetical protein [bacterium]